MEMRVPGRTGVSVSKFWFGAGMFGYSGNASQTDAGRMVHRAIDAGINYFDTSDVYSHGESESMLGKSLQGRRPGGWHDRSCGAGSDHPCVDHSAH